jgi:hypothetical protein
MEAVAEPCVEVTRYTVSVLPEGSINRGHYNITVEERHPGRWGVCWLGRCLNADGEWDYEPSPSNREDDWLEAHRFDLDTALRLAKEAAPGVTVNGMTAAACVEWEANRG